MKKLILADDQTGSDVSIFRSNLEHRKIDANGIPLSCPLPIGLAYGKSKSLRKTAKVGQISIPAIGRKRSKKGNPC